MGGASVACAWSFATMPHHGWWAGTVIIQLACMHNSDCAALWSACRRLPAVHTPLHRFPQVRVYLDASPLRLHISPARLHRITHIVAALSTAPDPTNGPSSSSSQSAGAGQGSASLPLWLTDAEYTAKVGPVGLALVPAACTHCSVDVRCAVDEALVSSVACWSTVSFYHF